MTYFIGALCIWHAPFAAGLSVILTIILMLKHPTGFANQWITENEFRDGLFLLALILVALPLTPNTPLWGTVLNPHIILKLLSLILAVQARIYYWKRLLSAKNALILSPIASGLYQVPPQLPALVWRFVQDVLKQYVWAPPCTSCVATLLQLLLIVGTSLNWLKIVHYQLLQPYAFNFMGALAHALTIDTNGILMDACLAWKKPPLLQQHSRLFEAAVYGLSLLLGNAGLIIGTLLASLFEIVSNCALFIQGDPPTIRLSMPHFRMAAHAIAKSINASLTGGSNIPSLCTCPNFTYADFYFEIYGGWCTKRFLYVLRHLLYSIKSRI